MAAIVKNVLSPASLAQMPLHYKTREEAINALVEHILNLKTDQILEDTDFCQKLSKMGLSARDSAEKETYKILEEVTDALKPYIFDGDTSFWSCFQQLWRRIKF